MRWCLSRCLWQHTWILRIWLYEPHSRWDTIVCINKSESIKNDNGNSSKSLKKAAYTFIFHSIVNTWIRHDLDNSNIKCCVRFLIENSINEHFSKWALSTLPIYTFLCLPYGQMTSQPVLSQQYTTFCFIEFIFGVPNTQRTQKSVDSDES